MTAQRKISYGQALAIEKAQRAARAAAKLNAAADQTTAMSADRKQKWDDEYKAAVAAYRAKKGKK